MGGFLRVHSLKNKQTKGHIHILLLFFKLKGSLGIVVEILHITQTFHCLAEKLRAVEIALLFLIQRCLRD